jgi:hypothetical protein
MLHLYEVTFFTEAPIAYLRSIVAQGHDVSLGVAHAFIHTVANAGVELVGRLPGGHLINAKCGSTQRNRPPHCL